MHELSIAVSLVEAACKAAEPLGPVRVEAVHVRLGPLSGAAKEPLLFSFDLACRMTPLEGARLVIEEVPVVIWCAACRAEQALSGIQSLRCPACGTPAREVIRGTELELTALEVITDAPAHHRGPAGCSEEERPAGP